MIFPNGVYFRCAEENYAVLIPAVDFAALDEVAAEVEEMREKHGGLYAKTKLMEAASKITKIEIQPIHEEEMRKARIENEKEGIYFPADDPDAW